MEHELELVILALLVAVAALLLLSGRVGIPYPILLVIGGLALGSVPGAPRVELDPELVFLIFLPPLLYAAAFFSSLRDLRANLRPISLLSIGLVLATTAVVAVVAHAAIDGLPWAAAFVLGAIVSPTDPVAATAIARRLGVPRRVVTIVEGESLINDGTALVAYRFAVAAVLTGSFSLWEAGLRFVANGVGGVAIGLAVGWLVAAIRRRLENPPVEMALSLMTAYFAYLPAEALGVSGVLAAVTVGVYLGWRAPILTTPGTRIQLFAVWEILVFGLNSALFILIGLHLPTVLEGLEGASRAYLLWLGVLVSAAVIVTRIAWVVLFGYAPRLLSARLVRRAPLPDWRNVALIAWTGMRGAVSLAAALALPLETAAGAPFPARDLIVFLAFAVILATLVLQGLSLPPVIGALGVHDEGDEEREEVEARLAAAHAAIERIEQLAEEDWVREDSAERLRNFYDYRRRRFEARTSGEGDGRYEDRTASYMRFRSELLAAEREALLRLRNEGRISDDVMHRIERELDLEETRLES